MPRVHVPREPDSTTESCLEQKPRGQPCHHHRLHLEPGLRTRPRPTLMGRLLLTPEGLHLQTLRQQESTKEKVEVRSAEMRADRPASNHLLPPGHTHG